jgi:hypothetical protein
MKMISSYRKPQRDLYHTGRWGANRQPSQLLPRARRRGASGGDRRRGVGRAHPVGYAPQLGAAGRDR